MSTLEATTKPDPLQALLLRYRHHADEEAMEELVARTRPRLLRAALRVGGAADAEDAVQGAYYSLLRQSESPRTSVEAWLATAVVRIAFRRKARAQRQLDLAARLAEQPPPNAAPRPAEQVLRAEEHEQLTNAVHRLPDHYREAIVLHYLQGLTAKETAALLDVPESTVRTRLQRGRALLAGNLPAQMLRVWLVAAGACLTGLRSAQAAVLGGSTTPLTVAAVGTLCLAGLVLPGLWGAGGAAKGELPMRRPQVEGTHSTPVELAMLPGPAAAEEPPTLEAPPEPLPAPVPYTPPVQPAPRATPLPIPDAPESETDAAKPTPAPPAPPPRRPHVVTTVYQPAPVLEAGERPSGQVQSKLVSVPKRVLLTLQSQLKKDAAGGLRALLDHADRVWSSVDSYRADLASEERRNGRRCPREEFSVRFHKPYCTLLQWHDEANAGKTVLFVRGKYGDVLSLKVKFFFWIHVTRELDDSSVLEKANRRVDEISFGAQLTALREWLESATPDGTRSVTYEGRELLRPKRTKTIVVALTSGYGLTRRHHRVHFDEKTLMPVRVEINDAEGFLGLYEHRNVVLNPADRAGRPELTTESFYRSSVFPGEWEKAENWLLTKHPEHGWRVR